MKISLLAEQNIIGSLLMEQNSIEKIYGILEPDMFTNELLGRVYHEYQRAYDRRYDLNLSVIEQKLRSDNFPSSMIIEELRECLRVTETSTNIVTHANVLVSDYKAHRADLILSSRKITPNNFKSEIGAILSELEVLQSDRKTSSKTLAEIAKENKANYFCEKKIKPLHLGFDRLDNLLGGLRGGDLVIFGARPSVGKSALVTQITRNLAKQGKRIGFYNLEMQDDQVYERFVASESGIGLTRIIRATHFLGDEKERFDRANETLENTENIHIISEGGKSVNEIRAESREKNYDLIIVDYLQLLKTDGAYRGNRTAEVGEISRSLKNLAMEFNIPVIALSQLNRASEGREKKEPTMADLREAGNIEQDASVIILLWNLNDADRSQKGCKIEKNRQGECGKVVMKFNGDTMQFEETDEDVKEASEWKPIDNPFG